MAFSNVDRKVLSVAGLPFGEPLLWLPNRCTTLGLDRRDNPFGKRYFAELTQQSISGDTGLDNQNALPVLLGNTNMGRDFVVEHAASGTLSLIQDQWKYIESSQAQAYNKLTDIELGNAPEPQLYNLIESTEEQQNVADANPEVVEEMRAQLESIKAEKANP